MRKTGHAGSHPTRRRLITFPDPTKNAHVDGIAGDPTRRRLLVPDSPTGQLFAVPISVSATPRLIATHLGRPVAATVDWAGDSIVASWPTPGLVEIVDAITDTLYSAPACGAAP